MERRTKPPVLTSPWKIGFFVSLMLVFVSLGVAYFLKKTLGTPWTLPHITEWRTMVDQIIAGRGVLVDVWPIVVLVGVSSLVSYLAITGAVRKYKRYLDSGHDYKNLLSTLREIEDLDDADRIGALKNHDELRNLLNKIRVEHDERKQMLDEREKALESSVIAGARRKAEELSSDLNEQCGRLIEAMVRGRGRLPDKLNITIPELSRVEEAVRNTFANVGDGTLASAPAPAADKSAIVEGARAASRELEDMSVSARELESALKALSGQSPADDAAPRNRTDGLMASCRHLEGLVEALTNLGEESKSMAINTALRAGSGKADVVQVAEEVKEVAAQYGELSRSFSEGLSALQRVAESINDPAGAGPGAGSKELGVVTGKASLLAERVMLVTQKFQQVWDGSGTPAPRDEFVQVVDDGFETGDAGFGSLDEESFDSRVEVAKEDNGDFQSLDAETSLLDDDEEATRRAAAAAGSAPAAEDEGMFAELSDQQPLASPSGSRAPTGGAGTAPAADSGIDTSGLDLEDAPRAPKKAAKPAPKAKQEDDNVIDLYELGAVDYDPVAHG